MPGFCTTASNHQTIKPFKEYLKTDFFSSCHRCHSDNLKVFFLSMFHMFHFYFLTLGWNWRPQAWPDCHSTSSWDEVLLPDSNEASLRKSTGWWCFFHSPLVRSYSISLGGGWKIGQNSQELEKSTSSSWTLLYHRCFGEKKHRG